MPGEGSDVGGGWWHELNSDADVCATSAQPTPHALCPLLPLPHRLALVSLYYFELAFYLASMFMLLWWEARRKDFAVMMLHHVVTATLIGLSLRLKCVDGRGVGWGRWQDCVV